MESVSKPNLALRLSLYRRLLSRTQVPRSEEELIRFVIDAIHEHFPHFRASLSWITDDKVTIVYSQQPEGMASLTGKTFRLGELGSITNALRGGNPTLLTDVRTQPALQDFAETLRKMGGNISRLDVPFADFDGNAAIISLTSPTPVQWDSDTVELVKEIGDLIKLMLREARTEEQLRRNEIVFRQFAENLNLVFWMIDIKDDEVVYVSPAFETIWGRPVDSLYRDRFSFLEAIHPEDRPEVLANVRNQTEGDFEQRYRVVRPDGGIRWIKDRGFVVRDERSEVYRVVGIAEDVTALHEAQVRLEGTQAQVISNAKFAALGEMASGIAHEINNPLAVIHGLTVQLQELFRQQVNLTPMVLDSLASMEKMSNRIAGIVKGLQTFSRHTAGDPKVPCDLKGIVQETLALCQARLTAADITVRLNLPPGRVLTECRSSEISQVLLNLMSNAYDAVTGHPAPREISVVVHLHAESHRARLIVEDSGPGISAANRDRIFQPFFTTKEVGRGTGLGLSISKGIVEAHGGTMFLDTGSPKTRFVVELATEST